MSGNLGLADFGQHYQPAMFGGQEAGDAQMFGRADMVGDLNKALATNGAIGANGAPLIPQSLEGTLNILSFKMQHLKLWNRLTKKPAYAITEEYDVLVSYGQANEDTIFMTEGGLPGQDDSEYDREYGTVKFLGTQRAITHPMTLVRTIESASPAIDLEDRNGTLQVLKSLEVGLFTADSRINPLAFKGIFQQIEERAPQNVIDLRGKPFTDVTLEDLDNRSNDMFGNLDLLLMDNRQKNNLTQYAGKDKRFMVGQGTSSTNLGLPVEKYIGNNSTFSLESHQFLRAGGPSPTVAKDGTVATPTNFTATVRAATGGEVAKEKLANGTYVYGVTAINLKGETVASFSTPVSVGSGDVVELNWDNIPGATLYRIYRQDVGSMTNALYLTRVGRGSYSTVTYVDLGKYLPGTSTAYGLMLDGEEGMAFKQLAPLMKMQLAQIDTSMRWVILLYGVLQVYQPMKQFVFINVGNVGVTHDIDLPRQDPTDLYVPM